jgi:hypothetical protein
VLDPTTGFWISGSQRSRVGDADNETAIGSLLVSVFAEIHVAAFGLEPAVQYHDFAGA